MNLKKNINNWLKLFGIASVVTLVWQVLEITILGEIKANRIDAIIGTVLTFSLYFNLKTWNKKGKKKESDCFPFQPLPDEINKKR